MLGEHNPTFLGCVCESGHESVKHNSYRSMRRLDERADPTHTITDRKLPAWWLIDNWDP